jgi:hypothetical protein
MLAALMGFVALAVDVGMLFRTQRQMQIAADAAAVAAALDYKYNDSASSAVTQGCAAATANGVTNTCTTGACSSSVTGAQVCIMVPPADGPNEGVSGLVEAIVQDPYPTFFMKVFNRKTITVSGRAVAGAVGAGTGCVLTLARSGVDISLTGSGTLEAPHCDIYDNSTAADALELTGSGSITANAIGIGGNDSVTGSGTVSPAPQTGMPPAADPLTNLPTPSPQSPTGSCTASSNSSACNPSYTGSSNHSIGPGTYTSISNTGSGTLTLTAGNYYVYGSVTNTGSGGLVMGAGNYTIMGNFQSTGSSSLTIASGSMASNNGQIFVGGNMTLTGSGSLTSAAESFYTEGASTVTGSGGMNLTAPTSGTYNGVLFFQSRSDSDAMAITGSTGDSIQGIFYAPAAPLTLTGSGTFTVSLDIIVDSLNETGSGTINVTDYASSVNNSSVLGANYGTTLTAKMVMVE